MKRLLFVFVMSLFTGLAANGQGLQPYLEINGKLHRVKAKERKNKEDCIGDCKDCFSICDVKFSIGVKKREVKGDYHPIIISIMDDKKAVIYFPVEVEHAETEFGIDEKVSIPKEALKGTGLTSLTLMPGEYKYDSGITNIDYNGKSQKSYGNVVVNIKVEK